MGSTYRLIAGERLTRLVEHRSTDAEESGMLAWAVASIGMQCTAPLSQTLAARLVLGYGMW